MPREIRAAGHFTLFPLWMKNIPNNIRGSKTVKALNYTGLPDQEQHIYGPPK